MAYKRGDEKDNELTGTFFSDTLLGMDGEDRLWAGAGADYLDGGDDNDVLEGVAGNNTLRGRGGRDIIISGAGRDYINGGSGVDLAGYEGTYGTLYVDLMQDTDRVTNEATVIEDQLVLIENVLGTDFNDNLSGDILRNEM